MTEAIAVEGAEVLRYQLPGRPVSWQRSVPTGPGGRVLKTPAKARAGKAAHQLAANAAMRGRRSHSLEGLFAVEITCWYDTRVYGDIDRLAGLVLDALEGIVYKSDRQVCMLYVKRPPTPAAPSTHVIVRRVS